MKNKSGLFKVSTIKVSDRKANVYETALVLDNDNIKIFEVYATEKEAKKGHLKWVKKSKNMTLDEFNSFKSVVDDYKMGLAEAMAFYSKNIDI